MARFQGLFYEDLGKRLTQARRAVGIKQGELARAVGLSRTSIVNIEKGRQPIQVHVLTQLAATLGTDVTALLPPLVLPLEEGELTPQLKKLDTEKRAWVERIIGTPALPEGEKEKEGVRQILTRKKESDRTSQLRRDKKPSRTSRRISKDDWSSHSV